MPIKQSPFLFLVLLYLIYPLSIFSSNDLLAPNTGTQEALDKGKMMEISYVHQM